MTEIDRIKERYSRRNHQPVRGSIYFSYFSRCERELLYYDIIRKNIPDIKNAKVLEVGAGGGDNLLAFKRFGFEWDNIYANELLEERVCLLRKNVPNANIIPGDALTLEYERYFDIVFQSTVFTSILDFKFKVELAKKIMNMIKEDGIILWYDFKYDNPRNPDVKGIGKAEIRKLFSGARKAVFYSVTLAPPIGRKIGKLYNIVNTLMPFLRTHLVAEIHM